MKTQFVFFFSLFFFFEPIHKMKSNNITEKSPSAALTKEHNGNSAAGDYRKKKKSALFFCCCLQRLILLLNKLPLYSLLPADPPNVGLLLAKTGINLSSSSSQIHKCSNFLFQKFCSVMKCLHKLCATKWHQENKDYIFYFGGKEGAIN